MLTQYNTTYRTNNSHHDFVASYDRNKVLFILQPRAQYGVKHKNL